jgi:Leucine-rich repeat (LRR) protein
MRLLFALFFFAFNLCAQEGVWYKSLETALEHPSQVYQLQLKRKGFTNFPKELSQFPNLVKLDLSKNKIQSFPDSLSYLSKLTFLDLSRNGISKIPKHISQLESIVHLDLWDNYINVLPLEIGQLVNLKYLDIRGVAIFYQKYNLYLEMMKSVDFFMSEPCDCQE